EVSAIAFEIGYFGHDPRLLSIFGVRAEHAKERALLLHALQRRLQWLLGSMAVHVHEEDVRTELLPAGARLDLREVDGAVREFLQCADQEPGAVLDDEGARQGRLVIAARRGVLFSEHHKAREIRAAVLDAAGENFSAEDLGRATSADGGGLVARHHLLHGG